MTTAEVLVPRPASTVVLLRDAEPGLETYILRRASTMAFAPDMHVFPGGKVDQCDYRDDLTLVGATAEQVAQRASCDVALARALVSCAVRETHEESGVVVYESTANGISVDLREVVLFDHWVTPEVESRRYDVRFFMTCVPSGQEASLVTTEAVHAEWIRPADAIMRFEAGSLAMLPPTEAVLRFLATANDAAAALRAAAVLPVQPKLPRMHADGSWNLVNAYDGSVITPGISAPHTREDTGRP